MVQGLLYHVFGGLKVIFENDGLACVGCAGKKKVMSETFSAIESCHIEKCFSHEVRAFVLTKGSHRSHQPSNYF